MSHEIWCDFCGQDQRCYGYGKCCQASSNEREQKRKEQSALCNAVYVALTALLRTGNIEEDKYKNYISVSPGVAGGVEIHLNKNATQKLLGKIGSVKGEK